MKNKIDNKNNKELVDSEDIKTKTFVGKTKKKAKGFLNDFKKFAFKGNMFDLAIAVVIGTAFGAIVTSLVSDIIMPWIALLIGDVSFTDLKIVLKAADVIKGTSEIAFRYGVFIQKVFEFLIIAFSIFIVIRIVSSAREKFDDNKKREDVKTAIKAQSKSEELLTEIRDLLKNEKTINFKKTTAKNKLIKK